MKKIEKKLSLFFDYITLIRDEEIDELVKNAEGTGLKELSDDQIGMVNAAGEPTVQPIIEVRRE